MSRAATNRLSKARAVFSVYIVDRCMVDINSCCYLACRMARVKERNNMFNLKGRKLLHNKLGGDIQMDSPIYSGLQNLSNVWIFLKVQLISNRIKSLKF
jgi:hypothetical protein